ncbi:putative transmembrane protein [Rhodopirellula islandica]|uniref:Transmembrane protein n=1 Tax=Rhodopirellula islandica TaxID=595434 RepID=A0A0J1B7E3_RHOIS|nr:hypothetical protein [Rhodopirellula islandica]KLU02498.1 putative transmembrane protein [Rhodopirellula islandica]
MTSAKANLGIPAAKQGVEPTAQDPHRVSGDAHRSIVIQPGSVAPAYWSESRADDAAEWSNRPAATLAVLFFVTGAFGIPLLWRNPNFATWQRFLWSIVVLVYTIALFAGVGMLVLHTLAPAGGN